MEQPQIKSSDLSPQKPRVPPYLHPLLGYETQPKKLHKGLSTSGSLPCNPLHAPLFYASWLLSPCCWPKEKGTSASSPLAEPVARPDSFLAVHDRSSNCCHRNNNSIPLPLISLCPSFTFLPPPSLSAAASHNSKKWPQQGTSETSSSRDKFYQQEQEKKWKRRMFCLKWVFLECLCLFLYEGVEEDGWVCLYVI